MDDLRWSLIKNQASIASRVEKVETEMRNRFLKASFPFGLLGRSH